MASRLRARNSRPMRTDPGYHTPMNSTIDLRSDTVTHPTPSMREAMARAEVGDDVYGEDPTVRRLEDRAAELLGMEAAVFVPTGTMGNQVAVHLHSRPGTEVIGESKCHIFNYEMGGIAALSSAFPRPVAGEHGILEPEAVEGAIQPAVGYATPTSLIVLENTHNLAGGRIVSPARMRRLVDVARRHGLPVHLDGARIFNAAAALECPPAELTGACDTVMFCLSKGLAAPVGSMLVGSDAHITEARRIRRSSAAACARSACSPLRVWSRSKRWFPACVTTIAALADWRTYWRRYPASCSTPASWIPTSSSSGTHLRGPGRRPFAAGRARRGGCAVARP